MRRKRHSGGPKKKSLQSNTTQSHRNSSSVCISKELTVQLSINDDLERQWTGVRLKMIGCEGFESGVASSDAAALD